MKDMTAVLARLKPALWLKETRISHDNRQNQGCIQFEVARISHDNRHNQGCIQFEVG